MKSHASSTRILLLVSASLLWQEAPSQELRMWTDKASGKTVEAAYVSADSTKRTVTIKTAAGQEFELPVARLNEADIEYIRQKLTVPPATTATPPAPAPTPPATKPAAAVAKAPAAPKGEPAPPKPEFKVLPAKGFKGPSGLDFVRNVQRVRPRIIQNAQGWAALKDMAAKDPAGMAMLTNLKKNGEFLLAKPEMSRVYITEASPVNPGSQTLFRISLLGALNFIDGDPKWKERAVREMGAVTDNVFGDWYPGEPVVTKDFLIAASMAYDWFKDGFNAEQLKKLREFIHLKGVDPLAAHLKGEPVPATAKKVEPGSTAAKDPKAPVKAPKKREPESNEIVDSEEMGMCAALIIAGVCMVDDDPAITKKALEPVGKLFSKGVAQFSPGGVWPEGLEAGDVVMDSVAMVLQTLRSACGTDFGLSVLEGVPQIGAVRMQFTGPTRQVFNYGDTRTAALTRAWVGSWLSGVHGNPGVPAAISLPAKGEEAVNTAAFLDVAGQLMYHNPQAAGYGAEAPLDFVTAGGEAAALRSAWDPTAMFLAFKGGHNVVPTAQLDIGSFVLDAGGVRWGVELGAEDDKAPGFNPAADRAKRYGLYLEGTKGQNTLVFIGGKDDDEQPKKPAIKGAPAAKGPPPAIPGCQDLDAKAAISGFNSTPERGIAVLNMTDAYHKVKSASRGAMMVRGAQPYLLLQDDLVIKGTSDVDWQMHTKSDVSASGTKATLTSGKATLTASLLSPAGAEFVVDDPPAKPPGDLRNRDLQKEKVKVLKVKLRGIKGEQRIAIAFALGSEAPAANVVPIALWLGKK